VEVKGPVVIFDFEKRSVTHVAPDQSLERALYDALAVQKELVTSASGTPKPKHED
jgi:hypothetical protein